MAHLLLPETKYLCDWTVMMKKVNATETSNPMSSPSKIADMNVTIQMSLWKRGRREKEDRDNKQNWEKSQVLFLNSPLPFLSQHLGFREQIPQPYELMPSQMIGSQGYLAILLCILGHFSL